MDDLSLNQDHNELNNKKNLDLPTRVSTPPTPNPLTTSASDQKVSFNENELNIEILLSNLSKKCQDYLQLIEPIPVLPPNYNTLPPGGCPRFPIIQPLSLLSESLSNKTTSSISDLSNSYNLQNSIKPPSYSPAIYKIGVVSRKVEWVNPYELSTNRSWKFYIMELNSTQLNFYSIPSNLELQVLNFRTNSSLKTNDFNEDKNSIFTNEFDYQFYNFVNELGLLDHSNSITKKSLVRTYSLQYSRIGLATDYKKKANVLRLRIENEQILLNFSTTEELINWNLSINIGKDVAVDLSDRELPRYRTVPRRRRRRNDSPSISNVHLSSATISRLRSVSDSSKFKGTLKKLKFKLSSKSNTKAVTFEVDTVHKGQEDSLFSVNRSNSAPNLFQPTHNNHDSQDDDEDADEYDEEFNAIIDRSRVETSIHSSGLIDNDQEDINDFSDLHHSDIEDEEDEEDEVDEVDEEIFQSQRLRRHHHNTSFSSDVDYKWNPANDKPISKRKYYRNCLRCIKPLTMDESWVDKTLVKPTTLSPLNMAYLRIIKYGGPNGELLSSCHSSSLSLNSLNKKQTNALFKEGTGVNLPDFALTKLPNHFLKEFNVGNHGLIPKEII
ncbi:unnamed protein product [Candida verbasci]|uniref:PH domain-containing protein n=1 Tax=Candida verbasci TaxID=1227364 RepID=A0A9W4XEY8_9ASCO|nr:unnamed protein product [Candida verbasci]